jgi:hypothetical protein
MQPEQVSLRPCAGVVALGLGHRGELADNVAHGLGSPSDRSGGGRVADGQPGGLVRTAHDGYPEFSGDTGRCVR